MHRKYDTISTIQHQVGNSLHLLMCQIDASSRKMDPQEFNRELTKIKSMVHTMSHAFNMASESPSGNAINASLYIRRIYNFHALPLASKTVDANFQTQAVHLSYDEASTLGFIVNDFLFNLFELAYTAKNPLLLNVQLAAENGGQLALVLQARSDEPEVCTRLEKSTGENLFALESLVAGKLSGDVEVTPEQGVSITIRFPAACARGGTA